MYSIYQHNDHTLRFLEEQLAWVKSVRTTMWAFSSFAMWWHNSRRRMIA
jgi:hypothetical protein